jgi:hypothetical protein
MCSTSTSECLTFLYFLPPLYLPFYVQFFIPLHLSSLLSAFGARGSVVVKALCDKPEGRGFDTR